ncbi:MAG: hypothetical protein JKX68_07465 [Flavobacteriales bacterium]|nr:hypothetical protein [Flavobacteriales bacterium]
MAKRKNQDKSSKENLSKIEQEIVDVLNSQSIEFEGILDVEHSPLQIPVKETLIIKDKSYFKELCNWLSNGYQQNFYDLCTKEDYVIRHTIFPPEQFNESKNKQSWKPILDVELEFKKEPAKDRIFEKSPQHHVFLISILEAIGKDVSTFIEIYAKKTDKRIILNNEGGMLKCINILIQELGNYIEKKEHQLIPTLYHSEENGLYMTSSLIDENSENEDDFIFEFGFSKITSDCFTRSLIYILRKKANYTDDKKQITSKEGLLDSTEKALIISYLQDAKEFITSHEQTRINELVSLLTDSSKESVKKVFQKIHPIKRGILTPEQAKARLKNLKNILPIFNRLELPEIVEKVQSRIKEVESFIK